MTGKGKSLDGFVVRPKGINAPRPKLETPAPPPAPEKTPGRGGAGRKKMTVFLDEEAYQRMRVHCFETGKSHQDFMADAVAAALDRITATD